MVDRETAWVETGRGPMQQCFRSNVTRIDERIGHIEGYVCSPPKGLVERMCMKRQGRETDVNVLMGKMGVKTW